MPAADVRRRSFSSRNWTVLDCLAHFTHKETVEMRCEKCGKLCDFEKRLRVKRRPPVLVRTPTTRDQVLQLRADLVKKLNLHMTQRLSF